MVYILTKNFNTSTWIYYDRREEGSRFFPKDFKKIHIPTSIADFTYKTSSWPPKTDLDGVFNIKQYSKMNIGGHFAALKKLEILINDIVKFFRTLR